jgi:hypothetical protein
MIGRDFSCLREPGLARYGDVRSLKGPVRVCFLDSSTVALLDADRCLHIQRLGGTAYHICSKPTTTEKEEEEEEGPNKAKPLTYVDISPAALCTVPMTNNVAIADTTNVIKLVNRHEWFVDRMLGGIGSGLGKLARVSGIDSFQLGHEVFFCVCEAGNQRVQVLSEGCKHVISMAGLGPMPGQFRNPTDISAHVCYPNSVVQTKSYSPSWYYGLCTLRDLRNRLTRLMQVGSYVLGKRLDDHFMYDFLYVSQSEESDSTVESVVFRVSRDNLHEGRIFNCTEEDLGISPEQGYACIWDAILAFNKKLKKLRHIKETRPHVNIAVADTGNGRVQVLRYFFTSPTDIYVPSFEVAYVIGGNRQRFIALEEPVAVAFTQTGLVFYLICFLYCLQIF